MDELDKGMFRLGYYSRIVARTTNPTELSIRNNAARRWLLDIPREEVVCLDVETTGLDPHGNDEILQVALCDGNCKMLLDSFVHPKRRRKWSDAQAIHGISPAMVANAPTISELSAPIGRIIAECTLLIGYNVRTFDLEFLKEAGIELPPFFYVYDLMHDCSVLYGRWNNHYGNYTFISLEKMAAHFHIDYDAHDSGEDAIATTKLFYKLLNSQKMRNTIKRLEEQGSAKVSETPKTQKTNESERINPMLFAVIAIFAFLIWLSSQ